MRDASNKKTVQQLAAILKQLQITDIVLSPGSRNAPLIIQFSNDDGFTVYSIVDERCAGFFALGMAQEKQKPVVMCCTSGSATVNYYPAITEAFYQNIPLIVISADRPKELIDQFDGQTIRQENVFSNHTLHNIQLDGDQNQLSVKELIHLQKVITESIEKQSPIHINISFEEPLYNTEKESNIPLPPLPIKNEKKIDAADIETFSTLWNQSRSKLILVGLQKPNPILNQWLKEISKTSDTIVLCEATSNLYGENFIHNIDQLIFTLSEKELEQLRPELLFTIGQNVISKKVKSFLRAHKPKYHFHLDPFWQPDTYSSLTHSLSYFPEEFVTQIKQDTLKNTSEYKTEWEKLKFTKNNYHEKYLAQAPFSDFTSIKHVIDSIPSSYAIHFGNSSVVRYAQLFSFLPTQTIYCNRGTSGIDGCTSTAIGFAVAHSPAPTVLITGDISFFYDSNALWNNYIPNSFRIILINNGGGNIFKIIPGPDKTNALENFFVTRHTRDAKLLCEMHHIIYHKANTLDELKNTLIDFYNPSDRPKLLEINTSHVANHEIIKQYFQPHES